MKLFPAIDLKNGQCVRLKKGVMKDATVFNHSPAKQALQFFQAGFTHLHIVDLDGAFSGHSLNTKSIEDIIAQCKKTMFIQLGGGIRSLNDIENWLSKGINRVILGTIAARNPSLVKEAARLFPEQIAIGIDAREGIVAVEGWAKSEKIHALELIEKYTNCGIGAIIYTDIHRDGMMQGLNLEQTLEVANNTHIPIIASGGVKDIHDIKKLATPHYHKIAGVIIGRALYNSSFDINEALEIAHNSHINT